MGGGGGERGGKTGGEAGSQKAQSDIKLKELDEIGGSIVGYRWYRVKHAGDKIYEMTQLLKSHLRSEEITAML